jgi:hypothetical protein
VKRGERKGGGGWDLDVRLSGNRLRGEPCMPLMQNERVGGTGSKGARERRERERERERPKRRYKGAGRASIIVLRAGALLWKVC